MARLCPCLLLSLALDSALPATPCPPPHRTRPAAVPRRQEMVQLLGRHWVIEDQGGKVVAEVPKGSKGEQVSLGKPPGWLGEDGRLQSAGARCQQHARH